MIVFSASRDIAEVMFTILFLMKSLGASENGTEALLNSKCYVLSWSVRSKVSLWESRPQKPVVHVTQCLCPLIGYWKSSSEWC